MIEYIVKSRNAGCVTIHAQNHKDAAMKALASFTEIKGVKETNNTDFAHISVQGPRVTKYYNLVML